MTQQQEALWRALKKIRTLEFVAQSQSITGWTGRGSGTVAVEEQQDAESIVFTEAGLWRSGRNTIQGSSKDPAAGRQIEFRNTYRWAIDGNNIRLEHLRFGEKHAVYLFDLAPESESRWVSVAPHLCRQDEYAACLQIADGAVVLNWTIIGPEKNEAILYRYGG